MRTVCLILLLSAALPAATEIALKADRVAHTLVLKEVYLNGQGPFHMMVDTGAASCLIRASVAKKLALRPVYAVEQETVSGVKRVPAAILDEVRVGSASDQGVEVLMTDVAMSGVDGVLGQSWLVRHDYLLDYRGRRLVLDAAAPGRGIRTALRTSDGRPGIAVEVDGSKQELVVDSGSSTLVLFRRPGVAPRAAIKPLPQTARLVTNSGWLDAGSGEARLKIGEGYSRLMAAVEVNSQPSPGLLPAAAFASVYVSNGGGFVVLVP